MSLDDTNRENYLMDLEAAVESFMRQGGQTVNQFSPAQACLYVGLQLEEMAEKIVAIADGAVSPERRDRIRAFADTVKHWADRFKAGDFQGDVARADHAQLIDADVDLAWVSIGALHSTSIRPRAAIAHTIYTNLDKFRLGPQRDANGKIMKPPGWRPPNFEPYVDTRVRD